MSHPLILQPSPVPSQQQKHGTTSRQNNNKNNKNKNKFFMSLTSETVSVAPSQISRIHDLTTLRQHLPKICSNIFQELGSQQQEATYQRCLGFDLEAAGVTVTQEPELHLTYKGRVVGSRRADCLLELDSGEKALLELKATEEMISTHRKQLEFYLHHFDIDHGYLINFPHDAGFPSVDHVSRFTSKVILGLAKRLEQVLISTPVLRRLRNEPPQRSVEVVEVKRTKLSPAQVQATKRAMLIAAPPSTPRFGITKDGRDCQTCLKRGGFCHLHIHQKRPPP